MAFYQTDGFEIPDYMASQVVDYVEKGEVPGEFLQNIISNDLKGAVAHADDTNMRNIVAYVKFFYNRAPAQCWGSLANMKAWVQIGGKRDLGL